MSPSDDPIPTIAPPQAPDITSVRYDAGLLVVAWAAQQSPAVTFTVAVYLGGLPPAVPLVAIDAGASRTAAVQVDLSGGRDPYVVVTGHSGSSAGHDSSPVPVVVDTTAVATAEADAGTGALALSWAGRPDERFLLRFSVNEGAPDPESPVTGTSTVVARPPRPGTVAAASLARVRIVPTDGDDAMSIGPYGAAFPLPTMRPDVLGVEIDGDDVDVVWTAVTSATGYRVSVIDGTSVVAQRDVAGPATRGVVPVTLDLAKAYAVVVQALVATGSGPASAPVAVVLRPPAITATTCDGAALTIAVTPPFGVAPTAYDVTVLQGSTPVRTVSVPPADELALALDWPVPAGAQHTVAVRARVRRASSPAATAPAVVATPVVGSVLCTDDLLVVTRPGALAPAGLAVDAVLVTDGTWGTPQRVGPDGTTTFRIPSGNAAVAVRGVVGIGTGPWSVPIPAPTVPPEITGAVVDGGRVALSWTGKQDGRYRAVAAGSDGIGVAAVVDGCSAFLALPATSPAVDALVSEIAGVAVGPMTDQKLLTQGPTLLTATVGAGRVVTVDWALPLTGPALTHVQPVVRWDGGEAALPPSLPAPRPLVLTLPDDVPGGASIALRGISGGGTVVGPLGNAAALLTVAPTGVGVTFDGDDLDVTWDPALAPLVDRYAVTLVVPEHNPVVTVVAGTHATIPYPSTGVVADGVGAAPTVTVAAMSGNRARGVACRPVDVIVDEPVITGAWYDGEALRLTWATPATQRAARVAIASGGVVGRQLDVGGTEAVIPLRPGPWTASVRFADVTSAGRATSVRLVTGAPTVHSVRFAAATGACAVSWAGVDDATAYTVTVVEGVTTVHEQSVDAPATSCVLPAGTLPAVGRYAVRVTATASTEGCAVEGPPSEAAYVPSTAPTGVRAVYDGVAVRVSWDAVAAAPVSGYRVSALVGGAATTLGDTTGTGGTWPLQAAPADGTTVVVQAMAGADVGAPSDRVALFPPGLFLGRSWLLPGAGPTVTPSAIVLSLPNLFTTAPDPSKLTGLDPTLGLTLAPASLPFGYTLTIPASSKAWDFASRVDVVAAWTEFVKKLQANFTVTAYGILAMQAALSRAMPQTFAESLYLAYGVNFRSGYFDLRPGMVLRAEYEAYQVVGPSSEQASLSGFVTTAVADYEVTAYQTDGRWLIGLDAFLAALAAQGGVTLPTPVPPIGTGRAYGSGGVLDAFAQTVQAPFCRVVYPRTFLPTNSNGATLLQSNAVLLATTSIDALEKATASVRGNLPPGNQVAAAYLRGRTVLRPMTRVSVNGTPRLVPVGTTLGQLLDQVGHRPPVLDRPLRGVSLRRPRAAAVTDAAPTAAVGDAWSIRLDWSPGDPGWLDLPLLHGDRVEIADATGIPDTDSGPQA